MKKCRLSGDVPYQSTQFNKYYGEYVAKHSATMHLNHKPGEIMQVDWAGDTAEVIDSIPACYCWLPEMMTTHPRKTMIPKKSHPTTSSLKDPQR